MKRIALMLAMLLLVCSAAAAEFDGKKMINVISREDGSGTRGAFVELTGVEQKVDGMKMDMTTEDAQITNSTAVMLAAVAGDDYAIGYVSLGSMSDSVKAVKIEGVEATAENVAAGSYRIARPFCIAYQSDKLSALGSDFIRYVMSAEGQAIVENNGYVAAGEAEAYAGTMPEGKLVIAGSSSVSPVMEKLAESYRAINAGAEIEIQTSDSTTGMTAAMDGSCEIGMASRALKEAEAAVLDSTVMAMDGIAVIVNHANPIEELSAEQICAIYTGEVMSWNEI
ncbi:MAG: substrate-binding domain-containing protein [Clostridia bacterium]|nr:substrate-binding domain-containing protein [Clostridia bacterium]